MTFRGLTVAPQQHNKCTNPAMAAMHSIPHTCHSGHRSYPLAATRAASRRCCASATVQAAQPLSRSQQIQHQQHHPSRAAQLADLQHQAAVIQALSQWAEEALPQYMPAQHQQQWQPSSLLPDLASAGGMQQLVQLKEEAQQLPTDALVVLAGLTVHAALVPAQLASSWGGAPGLRDDSGADQHVWARWQRQWAGDMNRVRSALSSYCYCCGCIDTRALDVSSHIALSSPVYNGGAACFAATASSGGVGDNSNSNNSHPESVVGLPYQQLFLRLLQARMLRVMHTNMSSLASYNGTPTLARILTAAAADLRRHELALLAVCCQVAAADPHGAVLALAGVVKEGVRLPGCWMDDDGWHESGASASAGGVVGEEGSSSNSRGGSSSSSSSQLYQDFMAVADCLGVWSVADIAAAVQELCRLLQVQEMPPFTRPPAAGSFNTSSLRTEGAADAAASSAQSSSAVAEAARLLLAYPQQLRRLAELQLEGRLRDRRRGRTRSAAFSWVHGREVLLV